jgi:hypothetical protein
VRPAVVIVLLAACSGGDDPPAAPPPQPTLVAPVDAAAPDGSTQILSFDPSSGMHLDDDPAMPIRSGGPSPRSRRTIEVLLRSSPPGATAVVDGQLVGTTPTYWEGEFTGREREFSFVLRDHALARYSFVPISNGIVHARLTRILPGEAQPVLPSPPPAKPTRRPSPPADARMPDDDAATDATDASPASDDPPVGPPP